MMEEDESNTTCEFHKLKHDHMSNDGELLKKGRIIMTISYRVLANGRCDIRNQPIYYYYRYCWALSTPTEPMLYSRFNLDTLKKYMIVDKVDIYKEPWIFPHLKKEVQYFIRLSEMRTRKVLFEKTNISKEPTILPLPLEVDESQKSFMKFIIDCKAKMLGMVGINRKWF